MKIDTIEQIEAIIQLVNKYQLDVLQVGDIVVSKSKHQLPVTDYKEETPEQDDDEALLFWSTGSKTSN